MRSAPDLSQIFMAASQCLQRRDAAGAERALAPVANHDHPGVHHLLGMARLLQGQYGPAALLLAKARAALPRDPVLAYSEGQALMGLGRAGEALASFQAASTLKPDFMEARFEVGRLLHQTGKLDEAEQVFRQILRLVPHYAYAQLALGAVLIDQGNPAEAEKLLRHALSQAPAPDVEAQLHLQLSAALRRQRKDQAALAACDAGHALAPTLPQAAVHRADCLQNLGRHEEALDIYRKLVAQDPANPGWHHSYNELLHRLGRKEEFLASYSRAPTSRPLLLGKAFFLAQDDRYAESLAVYDSLLARDTSDRVAAIGAARSLARLGRHDEARRRFAALIAVGPEPGLLSLAAEAALLAGDPQEAAALSGQGLALAPLDGACLAHLSAAWRMLEDDRDEALCGYDTLVRIFDLEPPEGYAAMADFNAELSEALAALHPDTGGYLGQSLRHGSQTPEQLFGMGHPLIAKLQARIGEAVTRYIAELPEDARHPFLSRRQRGFRYSGSWSSRLSDQGFHVNHIHPAGWISSCYYVALPPATNDTVSRQGWIKFGEPALDIPLRQPVRRAIQPAVGRLVLFPSYLWHGTIPFHDRAPRITVAFDVVPTG